MASLQLIKPLFIINRSISFLSTQQCISRLSLKRICLSLLTEIDISEAHTRNLFGLFFSGT